MNKIIEKSMKTKESLTILAVIVFVSLTTAFIGDPENTKAPDLIIENITYEQLPNMTRDQYGRSLMISGKRLKFTIRIKNVGTVDFAKRFYLSNTRTDQDIKTNFYAHSQLVNYNREIIRPNQSIDFTITDLFTQDVEKAIFLIDTAGKTYNGITYPRLEEFSYENNSYLIEI